MASSPRQKPTSAPPAAQLRVLIVAEHASTRFGGEAILPWHYFRLLRKRGVDAHLVVHERTREELLSLLPREAERMHFVPDQASQRFLHRLGQPLPPRVAENTTALGIHLITSLMQRKVVRELVRAHDIQVIHEPIPVSPKQPSFMYGLGAPVVIGPMNGGMDFPPAFTSNKGKLERVVTNVGRKVSHVVNHLIPGKKQARMLLVANERTARALPRSACPYVVRLVENGVDLSLFRRGNASPIGLDDEVRFAFVGRLIDLKRVDLLLEALARGPAHHELHVLGDGPMRPALEAQASALGLGQRVAFHGMLSQQECADLLANCDALVLPSMRECGGAVVLEAMALGLPVIATDWGGPADYVTPETGILIPPTSHESFVQGLHEAMLRLGENPALRAQLGAAGLKRVETEFDWERKIDRILEIYAEAAGIRTRRTEAPRLESASELG